MWPGEWRALKSMPATTRSSGLAALAVPNFRRLIGGQAISLIGSWTETVALAVLVLSLTDSGLLLGLATAARYAPASAAAILRVCSRTATTSGGCRWSPRARWLPPRSPRREQLASGESSRRRPCGSRDELTPKGVADRADGGSRALKP